MGSQRGVDRSLPYNALTTAQPTYLHSLISVHPHGTRSSSLVTICRTPASSHCSFRYASPPLWNQLPVSFHQPCINHSDDGVTLSNSSSTCSPLSPSIAHSLFHSRLKTHHFLQIFSIIVCQNPWFRTAFSDYTGSDLFC